MLENVKLGGLQTMDKFYTINCLTDNLDMGNIMISLSKQGIILTQSCMVFRDELKELGINVLNKSNVSYSLEWTDQSLTKEDIMLKLKEDYNIELLEIKASLNLARIVNNIINNRDTFNYQYLTEELLNIGDSKLSMELKIKDYLNRIESDNRTLLITDPFLFKGTEKEKDFLVNILKESKSKNIITYTQSSDGFDEIHKKLEKEGMNLKSYVTTKIHDRFWICPESKKGFVLGTSLNGIGRKLALINDIKANDVYEILSLIKSDAFKAKAIE